MDCKQVEELVAGYALSALSDEERRGFEAHVDSCPDCIKLLAEFKALAGVLPLTLDQEPPPARLKARILSQARQDVAESRAPARGGRFRLPSLAFLQGRSPYVATAVVALLAVLGVSIWNADLRSTNSDRAAEIARLERGVRVALAAGTEAAPAATGEVIHLPDQELTVLRVRALPALTGGGLYQMWLIDEAGPVSAGVLEVDGSSAETVAPVRGDPSRYLSLAVSLEPFEVASPTGPIVLAAKF